AGGGSTFVVYGGGFGPGANPPAVGTPISGSAEGFFSRTYDFSIRVAAAPEKAASVTTVTPSPTSPLPGQSVTLTAAVGASAPGSGTPTGSVDFFDTTPGTDLGTVPLSGGTAVLSTGALAAGPHTVTATYLGDGHFLGSAGDAALEVIPPAGLSGLV